MTHHTVVITVIENLFKQGSKSVAMVVLTLKDPYTVQINVC